MKPRSQVWLHCGLLVCSLAVLPIIPDAVWKPAGNEDPVADLREKDFRTLYQRILNLAPQPIGFGERWKASA